MLTLLVDDAVGGPRVVDATDQVILVRCPCQHGQVAPVERDGGAVAQRLDQPPVDAGEGVDRQTHQHEAQEAALRVVQPAADVERPLAVALVAHGGADVVAEMGLVAVGLEIVALGQIDPRHRMGAAEIDVVAVGCDDGRHVQLRQPLDLVAQQLVHLDRGQSLPECGFVLHVHLPDLLGDRVQHQKGREHGLGGVLGEHVGHASEVVAPVLDFLVAQGHRCHQRPDGDGDDQQGPIETDDRAGVGGGLRAVAVHAHSTVMGPMPPGWCSRAAPILRRRAGYRR